MLMEPVKAHARWWPCACPKCVSGLRRLEKTFNFLRCINVLDLVLKYGSDISEGDWLQLLFYFDVLIGIVASVIGLIFFAAVFQVLDWNFAVYWVVNQSTIRTGYLLPQEVQYTSRLQALVQWFKAQFGGSVLCHVVGTFARFLLHTRIISFELVFRICVITNYRKFN